MHESCINHNNGRLQRETSRKGESMKTFNYSKRVKEALNYWEQQKINGDATAQTKIDEILSINPVKPLKR